MAKNRNVTANLSWTGIAARNLVCHFTLFGLTKLINGSKSAGTIRVIFLHRPRNSWQFMSAYKWVPLNTDLFLNNSVCHQRFSCRFLLLDMWRTYTKAALGTCKDIFPPGAANTGGSQRAARSPECASPCPNLNLGGEQNPARLCYAVTLRRNAQVCTRPK